MLSIKKKYTFFVCVCVWCVAVHNAIFHQIAICSEKHTTIVRNKISVAVAISSQFYWYAILFTFVSTVWHPQSKTGIELFFPVSKRIYWFCGCETHISPLQNIFLIKASIVKCVQKIRAKVELRGRSWSENILLWYFLPKQMEFRFWNGIFLYYLFMMYF